MFNHQLENQKNKSHDKNSFYQDFDFVCFADYEEASRAIIKHLKAQFDFDLWMVTCVKGDDWIVLEASANDYGVKSGDVYNWHDSFCSRMVEAKGPNVAPNVEDVPAYVEAEIGKQFRIGSYIGLPMYTEQGVLFGTLCAIDPSTQTFNIEKDFPQIKILARILTSLLNSELKNVEQKSEIAGIRKIAHRDQLTGLLNRRGWDAALKRQHRRLNNLGSPSTVFTFDLDGLKAVNDTLGHYKGDELLKETANCLLSSIRDKDVVARFGGDEFAILALDCGMDKSDQLFQRFRQIFFDKGILVSIGQAIHRPNEKLIETFIRADKEMCRLKQLKYLHRSQSL